MKILESEAARTRLKDRTAEIVELYGLFGRSKKEAQTCKKGYML